MRQNKAVTKLKPGSAVGLVVASGILIGQLSHKTVTMAAECSGYYT
jgi:hypothetical protein